MTTCDEARDRLSNARDAVWAKRDAASNAREALSRKEERGRELQSEWDRLTAALVGRDREVEDLAEAASAASRKQVETQAHYELMREYEAMVRRGEKCPLDGYDDQRLAYRVGESERAGRTNDEAKAAKSRAVRAVEAMRTARERTQSEFDRVTAEKYSNDDATTTARVRSQNAAEALTAAERTAASAERVVDQVC